MRYHHMLCRNVLRRWNMRIWSMALGLLAIVAVFAVYARFASQESSVPAAASGGTVVKPPSSIEKPGEAGSSAHTNVEIFSPSKPPSPQPPPKEFYEQGN